MKLAITGGTGFVGSALLDQAVSAGHDVTALTRRPQPHLPHIRWIPGALDQPHALTELCKGADAVLHVAGVINAKGPAGFEAGNVTGTAMLMAAAAQANVKRFVLVSSLAAREERLSAYGASKARAEALLPPSDFDWAVVRPPAVYGPGDRETLELFRMAKRGLVLLPPPGRLSAIEVSDLCRLLLALAPPGTAEGMTLEPDDGAPGGWTHRAFAEAIADAVGRRARQVAVPAALLRLGAALDTVAGQLTGRLPKLSFDRARYFAHPDWVVDRARAVPPEIWRPQVETRAGLKAAADWYRNAGWL